MSVPNVKLTNRKSLIVLAVAIVLVAAGVIAVILLSRTNEDTTGSAQPDPLDTVLATGMEYSETGDVDSGLEYYDEQIEQRKDKKEKQQLLLYKSNFASSAAKHEIAVESAKEADAIESTPATLMALAHAYDSEGNKEQAITYYQQLLEASSGEDNMSTRYRVEWEQRIQELQG